ncbi:MAG: hypothetical protein PHN37_00015 [Candidatus Pacebacteria bacterium]|nr:hypothetical protein [Candidatus Paceibacterota bacterium]
MKRTADLYYEKFQEFLKEKEHEKALKLMHVFFEAQRIVDRKIPCNPFSQDITDQRELLLRELMLPYILDTTALLIYVINLN